MSSLSLKDRWFVIISFVYILYVIFPLFGDLTHIPVFIPSILVVAYVSAFYYFVFKSKPMHWLLVYLLLLFAYALVGHPIHINGMNNDDLPFLWRITIEAAWIMPSVMIAMVLCHRNDANLYRVFGIGSLVFVAISFVYILPMIIRFKNVLRYNLQGLLDNRPLGLPDYTLMHSYVLMLLPICYSIKYSVIKPKIVILIALLLFFYVVTQTAVTTSLLISVMIFLFALFFSAEKKQRSIVVLCLLAVFLAILYKFGFFLWLVDSLMPFFEGTAVSYKLQDLHDSMTFGAIQGGSLTGRMDFHQISKDSFYSHPIFGGGPVGGHSKVLDILGRMGLVVFAPFFMIIWTSLKRQLNLANSSASRAYLYFLYFAAFVYLYEKGIFGAAGFLTLFVIVPSAILALDAKVSG